MYIDLDGIWSIIRRDRGIYNEQQMHIVPVEGCAVTESVAASYPRWEGVISSNYQDFSLLRPHSTWVLFVGDIQHSFPRCRKLFQQRVWLKSISHIVSAPHWLEYERYGSS
jgi:hypothetical protein